MKSEKPKIALIRPYVSRWKLFKWYAPWGSMEFSLGLLYIGSYLKENNFDVIIIDGERTGSDQLIKEISDFKPDIIGITSTTFSFSAAKELAVYLKKIFPAAGLYMGGPHVSALPEESMISAAVLDGIVAGEGEETFLEIASGTPVELINGLIYRDGSGGIKKNPARRPEYNLDKYNLYWDMLDGFPGAYYPTSQSRTGKSVSMVISRGCSYQCSFCASKTISGSKRRSHSPEYTVNEIVKLRSTYGINEVYFHDDHFTLDKEWIRRFCGLMIEMAPEVRWSCATRTELLDEGIVKLLKESGCMQLGIGIESVSVNALEKVNKRLSLRQLDEKIGLINRFGIDIKGYFIFDIPGERIMELFDTVKFIFSRRLAVVQINYFTPLPGTAAYNEYPVTSREWPKLSLRQPLGFSKRPRLFYYVLEILIYSITILSNYFRTRNGILKR